MALADRIAVMDHGVLMQLDTPQAIYHRPANKMAASFISLGMVMPVTADSSERDGRCEASLLGKPIVLACSEGEQPRHGKACFRAEHVRIANPGEDGFDGVVKQAIYRGGVARIEFLPDAVPDQTIHFEQLDPQPFAAGNRARLRFEGGGLIPEKGVAATGAH